MSFFTYSNCLKTLLIWPLIEYNLHYFLHFFNESRHKTHHIVVHNYDLQNLESFWDLEYFYIILPALYLLNYPILFMGSAWYFLVHTIIHFCPKLLPDLSNYHLIHHKFPLYNFGITTTFYDRLFNTYKN